MEWILAAFAIAVAGLAVAAATGRFGELPDVVDDRVQPSIPASGTLGSSDLRNVEFAVVPRGYSMDQVDGFLDRLATQMDLEKTAMQSVATPYASDLE